MRTVRVVNETRNSVLAEEALWAQSFWTRLRGLLGRPEPQEGQGLLLDPCKSVHMWGMKYSLDILFSDASDRVVGLREELSPWKTTKIYRSATRVLELPVGSIQKTGTCVGDQLRFFVGEDT